ncbi:MAG TPA: PEP-CTERM sorting domain-containing protein [Kiritimatiellia bacterium]|nr:PEP-CTERM sorting domain-containing protein [Kiritimatiellia bacterium]
MKTLGCICAGLALVVGLTAVVSADIIVVAEDRNPTNDWLAPTQEIVTRDLDAFVNNSGVASNGTLSQTFTATSDLTLSTVEFAYRTSAAGSYTLSIYEVAGPTNTTISRIGGPLVNAVAFDIAADSTDYAVPGSASYSAIALSLTGVDQIVLEAGKYYEIELARTSGSGLELMRSGANSYAGGTAYANGALVSPGVDRDWTFALSSAVVPEPSSVLLLGLGGLFVARRLRSGRRA